MKESLLTVGRGNDHYRLDTPLRFGEQQDWRENCRCSADFPRNAVAVPGTRPVEALLPWNIICTLPAPCIANIRDYFHACTASCCGSRAARQGGHHHWQNSLGATCTVQLTRLISMTIAKFNILP